MKQRLEEIPATLVIIQQLLLCLYIFIEENLHELSIIKII